MYILNIKHRKLVGKKNLRLNSRTKECINYKPYTHTLVIDLGYYIANLTLNKDFDFTKPLLISSSLLGGRRRLKYFNTLLTPLLNLITVVRPKNIICFLPETTVINSNYRQLYLVLKSLNIPIYYNKQTIYGQLYNGLMTNLVPESSIVLTDNIDSWSCSNRQSKLSFALFMKNNRIRLFNEDTVTEILSLVLNTNKLVNKLRFEVLKYMGFQYLYILLLFINFQHSKFATQFNFSSDYIPNFTGATGNGYSKIAYAHQQISYWFLTKPDLMDIFLFSSQQTFETHLQRLIKIIGFDYSVLLAFKSFSDNMPRLVNVPLTRLQYAGTSSGSTERITGQIKSLLQPQPVRVITVGKKQLPNPVVPSDIQFDPSSFISDVLKDLTW